MKTVLSSLVAAAALSSSAWAQVSPTCDAPHAIDRYQLLRRLSMDLRGHPPSIAEYNALDALQDVPDATVQTYLQSDEFRMAMRHYHELLFWPNVTNVALNNTNSQITTGSGYIKGNTVIPHLASTGRDKIYRGFTGFSCGDDVTGADGGQSYLQTHFLMNPDGGTDYAPDPAYVVHVSLPDGGTATDEGYRMVTPYWSATPIPVCAYDAQETRLSAKVKDSYGNPVACNDYRANGDAACGCGPGLSYCYGGPAQQMILTQLREQLDRSVDDVTVGGQPYTNLITSSMAYETGTIAFWKQNLAPNLSFNNIVGETDPAEQVVAPVWDAANPNWQLVDRKDPRHAGVTTLPAYFLRFQTDRGRANRFRIDFMCQYFVPQTTLQAQPGCDPAAPDLTNRCYCQYCHSKLEPLAAYFGMFSEAGTTLMAGNPMFPAVNMSCTTPGQANNPYCQRYYVQATQANLNPGSLLPLQWVAQHGPSNGDYQTHLDGGPNSWAKSIITDHTFSQCMTQTAFNYLVKRPMVLGTGDASDETALLGSVSSGFEQQNYSFAWLVDQIITLPQYRRAR